MTEIRDKDKLFIAVAVPAAIVAAYLCLWRGAAADKLASLEKREKALVSAEDFPFELKRQQQSLTVAEAELKQEKAIPPPLTQVTGDPKATVAERELRIISTFREAGLIVMQCGGEQVGEMDARAPAALKATGAIAEPVRREYLLSGKYPAMVRALELICEKKAAAIVEQMSLSEDDKWRVGVWL